jgi:DNA-binding NtrC family response regulator
MKSCLIFSKKPAFYESNLSENESQYGLKGLEQLFSNNSIQFVDSKSAKIIEPKDEYIIIVDDDYEDIGKLLKNSSECGEISSIIVCTDAYSLQMLLELFKREPDLLTLDFQLRDDGDFIEETSQLYSRVKQKWNKVPVIGITNYESQTHRDGIAQLIKIINQKWDSVYDKRIVWTSLPTILRDKIRISRLNRDIEKIKIEVNRKEQIIEDLEAKKNADYAQLYFNRSINIQSIEAVNPAEIYRKYNKVSGSSFAVKCLLFKAIANARTDDPLIVAGPSGSGKDIIPRIIHDNSSRKHSKKYEVYDCTKANGADPKVIITELFGAVKGFIHGTDAQPGVFKRNNGGTVFIDELHHLPLEVQSMLLRVLQNKEITPLGGIPEKIDVRIIAGTNKDINQLVSEGKFHSDLYSRLCRDIINVPTLAQRGKQEIIQIAKFYLQKYCDQNKIKNKTFSEEAIRKLSEYSYSNFHIRELEGVVGNAAKFVTADNITENDIVFDLPEFITSEVMSQDLVSPLNKNAIQSFQMNRSKEWLWCIIRAIEKIKGKSNISSRDLIKVFVSPSNGTYSSDASFSPALKEHIDNILLLLENTEFEEHKENIMKLSVIRWAYQKKINENKNKG